jgi:molybdopterin-containing oxidoreductase family iron-sulfur binding subunit
MSRFIQLEGRLSLTGANADRRIRVRDSQLANIAAALANEIVVQRRMGPLASDPVVNAALEPFHLDKVAAMAQVPPALIRSLADELQAAAGHCVVLGDGPGSTTAAGSTLEAAVVLVNHALGNYNNSCFEAADAVGEPPVGPSGLQTLVDEMRGGKVDLLVIAGPNPLHDAAGIADFAKAMDSVGFVVSLNDRLDETARHADYLAPAGHALESWGDAALGLGVVAVQQPVLTPLYDTPGFLDVLVSVGAAAGAGGPVAAAFAASQPDAKGLRPAGSIDSPAYHYVKQHWEQTVLTQGGRWDDVLRAGEFQGPVPPALAWPPGASAVLASLVGTPIPSRPELEVELYPHHALGDGRAGNNGWLHELPDPITRLTWGGAVSIAPRRFDAMGLQNGDVVEVAVGSRKLALPAYRHAGMHEDQVSVPLGLGRTDCGLIGKGAGVNAFPLAASQGGRVLLAGLECSLRKLDAHDPLATTQPTEVLDRKPRPLVPTTTLAAFLVNPRAGTEQQPGGPSAFPGHDYKEQRWGMAIDLSLCNGCGKCVLGCQAENNIPVVGKKTIIAGRQMSWMRIDRYYDAPEKPGGWSDDVWDGPLAVVEEPRTLFEPMLCQHCDNAPCETVCPFNATMHSEDGMNQQVYNRCVGTRYCANNCPFKVRRYNWFEYSKVRDNRLFALIYPEMVQHGVRNARGRMQMKNNPEVTVRSRGVMEKCTFCVQRVREARAHATRQGQPGKIPDGQVVTACGEACPTGAIVFGDLNDPKSKVRSLVDSPRAMRLLEFLGVKPSVSYLTRVRNDNT